MTQPWSALRRFGSAFRGKLAATEATVPQIPRATEQPAEVYAGASIGAFLLASHRLMATVAAATPLAKHDLALPDSFLLMCIRDTPAELAARARRLGLSRNALSRRLRLLEEKKIIARDQSIHDGKASFSLTAVGNQVLQGFETQLALLSNSGGVHGYRRATRVAKVLQRRLKQQVTKD